MAERRRYRENHLGGRSLVVVVDGEEGYVIRYTRSCSGCDETGEYTGPSERGSGCEECGYTGKRRSEEWVPFDVGTSDVANG